MSVQAFITRAADRQSTQGITDWQMDQLLTPRGLLAPLQLPRKRAGGHRATHHHLQIPDPQHHWRTLHARHATEGH